MMYNVEELEQDVHKPITIPGMTNIQIQDNRGMVESGLNFL